MFLLIDVTFEKQSMLERENLIKALQLNDHIEGGWFRRTYTDKTTLQTAQGQRALASSIYYLLTSNAPVGHLHKNTSTILHFFQGGSPLRYTLISPEGEMEQIIMGPDPSQGHQLQMHVAGGYWKASELIDGDYGLISEVVLPEFNYEDMTLATINILQNEHPTLLDSIRHLIQ